MTSALIIQEKLKRRRQRLTTVAASRSCVAFCSWLNTATRNKRAWTYTYQQEWEGLELHSAVHNINALVKLHVVDERQRAGPARVGNRPRRHRIETQIVRSGVQNTSRRWFVEDDPCIDPGPRLPEDFWFNMWRKEPFWYPHVFGIATTRWANRLGPLLCASWAGLQSAK
jgi:hypothetical protein